MTNEAISFYEPGQNITGVATAAITGRRFLKISGNRSTASATKGSVSVAHADAAGRIAGVSQADAASGDIVGVLRGGDRVVPVDASGDIAAFAEVQVGANGTAVTHTTGCAVGYVVTSATNGGIAQVSLYAASLPAPPAD